MGGVAGGVFCAEVDAGDDALPVPLPLEPPPPPPPSVLRRPEPDPILMGSERPVMDGVDGVEGLLDKGYAGGLRAEEDNDAGTPPADTATEEETDPCAGDKCNDVVAELRRFCKEP